jgi:hypothetical protein
MGISDSRGRSHGGRQIPEVKKFSALRAAKKKMYLYLSKVFFHMRNFSLFFLKKNLEKIPLLVPKEDFSKRI